MLPISTVIRDLPAALEGGATRHLQAARAYNASVGAINDDLSFAWGFSAGSRIERSAAADAQRHIADASQRLYEAEAHVGLSTNASILDALQAVDEHLLAYQTGLEHVPFVGPIEDGDQLASRATESYRRAIGKSNFDLGRAHETADEIPRLDTKLPETRSLHDADVIHDAKVYGAAGAGALSLAGFTTGFVAGRHDS